MNIDLNKEQVAEVLQEIRNDKADALIAEGMEKLYQIGKCEGMQKVAKNMLLWSGGAYATATLMKRMANKSLSEINDKISELN